MLKTYRIIPLVFILFLFGFTLITVAPVIAQEQWNPSMGMCHNSRPCMKNNKCGKMCNASVRASKGWVKPNDTNNPETAETAGEGVCRMRETGNTWIPMACKCGLPPKQKEGRPCKCHNSVTVGPCKGKTPPPKVHEAVADGPWNPSMGMRHPDRPCMNRAKHPGGCGPDTRTSVQIANDPWDNGGTLKPKAAKVLSPAEKQIEEMLRRNEEIMKDFRQKIERNLPWDPSMGMRHPARPCMKNGLINPSKGCGPDNRASAIIARDPYDKEYIILKRAAPALEQACFRRCEGPTSTGWQRSTCKARCVAKRPNPRCKGGSFSGFYTTESSLRCLN